MATILAAATMSCSGELLCSVLIKITIYLVPHLHKSFEEVKRKRNKKKGIALLPLHLRIPSSAHAQWVMGKGKDDAKGMRVFLSAGSSTFSLIFCI